jgi:hypothetical protein
VASRGTVNAGWPPVKDGKKMAAHVDAQTVAKAIPVVKDGKGTNGRRYEGW